MSDPSPQTEAVRRTEEHVRTVCLLILAVVAAGAALHWLSSVLVPFALAMFLAIALSPVVDGIAARTKLGRGAAVGVTMVLGVLTLVVLGGLLANSMRQFVENQDQYEDSLRELAQGMPEWAKGVIPAGLLSVESPDPSVAMDGAAGDGEVEEQASGVADLVDPANVYADQALDGSESASSIFGAGSGSDAEEASDPMGELWEQAGGVLGKLAAALGTLLSQGITVMIFLMFLLIEQRRKSGGIAGQVNERVKRYLAVKIATSAVTGIAVGVSLALIGVDAALLFGILTFLLNFIPTIGSIVAVLLPLPVALAGGGVVSLVLAIVIPGAIQFAVGQIWENKKLGDEFDLRASVVLLALVFWGKLWGLVGMLLATPMTAVIKTLMEDWDLTRPISKSLGAAPSDEDPHR